MKKLFLMAGFLISVFSSTLSFACTKPNCTCGAENETKKAKVISNTELVRSHKRKKPQIDFISLLDMPTDILKLIFPHLDGKTALALSESYCGLWSQIVESRGHLVFKPETPIEVVEHQTKSIKLKSIVLSLYDKELNRRISLQCISDRLFASLTQCPYLEELHFSVQDNLTEATLISIGKIMSLKRLYITSGRLLSNLNHFSNLISLQHLSIRNMQGLSDISGIKDLPYLSDLVGWNLGCDLDYDHIQSVIQYRKNKGFPVEKRKEQSNPGPGFWGWSLH